jgi:hypothetical protein
MGGPKFRIIVLITLLIAGEVTAQRTISENQIWIGAECKLDFKKGWSVAIQYRVRETKDVSKYYGAYLFVSPEYKINKHFNVFADYRYASIVDVGHYHRFALGAEAQTKWKRFEFSFRPMVQKQNQYFIGDDEKNFDNSTYLRPRIKIQYKVNKRLDVYLYGEPFVDIQNKTSVDWWQNSVGMKYEYLKNQKVNFFYIWQPDYTKKYLHLYNIYGIDLNFTVKVGKKKEKKNKKAKEIDTEPG